MKENGNYDDKSGPPPARNVKDEGDEAAQLAAENARLQAEVERLKTDRETLKKVLDLFSASTKRRGDTYSAFHY